MLIFNIKINGSKIFKIFISIISIIIISIVIYSIIKVVNLAKSDTCTNNPNEISSISSNNYTNILKNVHDDLDNYLGKKINFTGYVYRSYDFNENEFVLARDMVVSSDFQTVVVGFLCESDKIKNFEDGTWVNLTGEITKGEYHGEIPLVKIKEIEEISDPDQSLVYPPDDDYLKTDDI